MVDRGRKVGLLCIASNGIRDAPVPDVMFSIETGQVRAMMVRWPAWGAAREAVAAAGKEEMEMPTDLTITLAEDRPGALSAVADALGRAGVNIDGVAMIEGTVHVLVEDAGPARQALEAGGLAAGPAQEVLVAEPADRPGALAGITSALAAAGVSVRFLYLGTGTRVVIGADDLGRARGALPAG